MEQMSLVQGLPSSQSLCWTQHPGLAVWEHWFEKHESYVQGLPSSQSALTMQQAFCGWPGWQTLVWRSQKSPTVHGFLSSHCASAYCCFFSGGSQG